MSGVLLALFGVCLGAAILEIALPGEGKESPGRLLHFFASLVVLVLILRPIFHLPDAAYGLLDGDWQEGAQLTADYEQVFSDAVSARSAEMLKEGVLELLREEFSVDGTQCEVTMILGEDGALQRIGVRLRGGGLLQDPKQIEERLLALFSCEVEVR